MTSGSPRLCRGRTTALRLSGSWILLSVILTASCTGGAAPSSSSRPTTSIAAATPSNPYGPFPYANDVQRQAFRAFLECASDHGVELEGPFADSRGEGVMFRNAGEPSAADQQLVQEACPQMDVGIFATPTPGGTDRARFEKALLGFAECMRHHGYAAYRRPDVSEGDPYHALDRLPFQWGNASFVGTLNKCTQPLENYVFSTL
jgi:hypothetical protein